MKTYFLSPNLDFPPPPEGPIALGSIIYDPKRPDRSLNGPDRVYIHPGAVYHAYKDDWKDSRRKGRDGRGGVWASFLQLILGIGGDVQVGKSHITGELYSCKRLETQFFQPDDQYLRESLRSPGVQVWTEGSRFTRKPIYMITGLKIARGISAETSIKREHGLEGNIGVDGTSSGAPVSVGPEVRWALNNEEGVSFAGSSDCVFAFQLIRICWRNRDDRVSQKGYNRGAMFGLADKCEVHEESEDFPGNWEIGAILNASEEFTDMVMRSTVDEFGEGCEVLASRSV